MTEELKQSDTDTDVIILGEFNPTNQSTFSKSNSKLNQINSNNFQPETDYQSNKQTSIVADGISPVGDIQCTGCRLCFDRFKSDQQNLRETHKLLCSRLLPNNHIEKDMRRLSD